MSTSEWDAFWEEQCHEFLETFPAQDTDMTSQESFISVPMMPVPVMQSCESWAPNDDIQR